MDLTERKKLASLINAFANKSLENGVITIEFEGKPYQNLIKALFKISEIQKIYDEDVLVYGIEQEILNRFNALPFEINEEDIEKVLSNLVNTLENNLADHVIVVPLQFAQFKNVIKIDNLTFIPRDCPKEDKLRIIARKSKKTLLQTRLIVAHTENSRSPDFLNYPLLCIKQTHHTSTVHYNSLNIAKMVIYAIRCFYYGNICKTSKDKTSLLMSMTEAKSKKASHLAIYSKENWRQNHKPLNFDVSVPFDLRWLEDKIEVRKFKKFLERIYFNGNLDDFNVCFLNSMVLFNESIKQNNSISTIITMTIAESILTRDKNEKRLRISAIIPRLMKVPKDKQREVANCFNELYHKRNNFVHSGESVTINYDYESAEPTILEKGRKIIAQLILEFPNFEKFIEANIPAYDGTNKQVRMKYWERYVDSIFQDIIY